MLGKLTYWSAIARENHAITWSPPRWSFDSLTTRAGFHQEQINIHQLEFTTVCVSSSRKLIGRLLPVPRTTCLFGSLLGLLPLKVLRKSNHFHLVPEPAQTAVSGPPFWIPVDQIPCLVRYSFLTKRVRQLVPYSHITLHHSNVSHRAKT